MLTIQQLSREVNVRAETLRVWERRYGFPKPIRDHRGHRRYPDDQVEALRVVRRLQDLGYRPGLIFRLDGAARETLLERHRDAAPSGMADYERLILGGRFTELENRLRSELLADGPERFVLETVTALVALLDRLWVEGTLSIAGEHRASDILSGLLGQQLVALDGGTARSRIVFLTLCGERHKLGLLMAAALFHAAGADCLVIRDELPLTEIARLVSETDSAAVALSFSAHYSRRQAKNDLATLRGLLPPEVSVIAGGQALDDPFHLPGLIVCTDLGRISALYARLERTR